VPILADQSQAPVLFGVALSSLDPMSPNSNVAAHVSKTTYETPINVRPDFASFEVAASQKSFSHTVSQKGVPGDYRRARRATKHAGGHVIYISAAVGASEWC
jgi:hypothetical protein